jgi:hypothetical protein
VLVVATHIGADPGGYGPPVLSERVGSWSGVLSTMA